MTLQYLLNGSPTTDYTQVEVFIGDNPVYDYKGSGQTIYLISQPFGDSNFIETVQLQEIINFSKDLDFPEEDIIFICEYELQELKSSEWHENKLTLFYS